MPFSDSPGFLGSEEFPRGSTEAAAAQAPAAAAAPAAYLQDFGALPQQQLELQQQRGQQELQQQQGLGVQVAEQQQLVGPAVGSPAGAHDADEDELEGYDDPPGLFDFEAGES